MRPMTDDERVLYNILKDNPEARSSNWEAVRQFYFRRYLVKLPDLKGLPTVWTIERSIRTLKSLYHECNDEKANKVHEDKVSEYKNMALDHNKPAKTTPEKSEQIEMKWWDIKRG